MTATHVILRDTFKTSGGEASTDTLFSHPNTPRVCMLADTLGWAATHNIPLAESLRGLPFTSENKVRTAKTTSVITWLLRPLLALYSPQVYFDTRWSAKVAHLRSDLNSGLPLSISLRKHFKKLLPEFYLVGVERAEAGGTLPAALTLLADQMRLPYDLAAKCTQAHLFTTVRVIGTSYILIAVLTTVVPKLNMIFADLAGTSPIAALDPVFTAITLGLGGLILLMLAPFLLLKLGRFGEDVLQAIPILGKQIRRIMLADFARSMDVFISQGDDLVTATRWSQKTARSFWMRNATQSFLKAVEGGQRWDKAWIALAPGTGLDDWIISNAAAREDPASGFALLAEWTREDLAAAARRLHIWLEPVTTFLMGAVVLLLAYSAFHALNSVVFAMS